MRGDADIAAAAALLAEPARATIVGALMDGQALPASELAARARIAPSTASEHLARLVDGGFLVRGNEGRHRYYELAGAAVAEAVEALALVAPQRPVRSLREATRAELLRNARTCYDHLAGRLGVALAQALERQHIIRRDKGALVLGESAEPRLAELGIEIDRIQRQRRPVVRGCMDWSERELHVAGSLGAAFASRFFELGWIKRHEATRVVLVTDAGRAAFWRELEMTA
jgi:DNA-binding transcriptional ArsR family regulator